MSNVTKPKRPDLRNIKDGQITPQGNEIPVPTRGDVMAALTKAGTKTKPEPGPR